MNYQITALEAALKRPVSGARADKKGKFPMASLTFPADGGPAEMQPLVVAMTQETWDNIQAVYRAAIAAVQAA